MAESKFTPERVKLLLEGARKGVPERTLAASVGINHSTLKDWFHSEDPEKQAFTAEFHASRAGAHVEMHTAIKEVGLDDWKASAWLLERTSEDYRAEGHGALGLRPGDMAQPLNEKQVEHRFIQSIAFPTANMQRILREALRRGNETLQSLVVEHVRTRPVLAEGHESEPEGPVPELTERTHDASPELVARIAAFLDVVDSHQRVALGGWPETGKTEVFAAACKDRDIVHTDDFITGRRGEWENEATAAAEACKGKFRFLIEGVRVVGCIRAGLPVDVLVWLRQPLQILTKGQQTMAKGRDTDLANLQKQRPDLKVVVI
jgi:hypothetical protein